MRQKERQRQKWALQRAAAKRHELPTILVGCEGRTEVEYLTEFRAAYSIPNVHLHFIEREGNDPSNLLQDVIKKFAAEDGDFDFVFCVFDRDDHHHFESTLNIINAKKTLRFKRRKAPLEAITSDPSFELWLLLHFKEVRSELHRDEAYKRLKSCCPRYEKGQKGAYDCTCEHIEVAIARAGKLEKGRNPSTQVGELILKLRGLWDL